MPGELETPEPHAGRLKTSLFIGTYTRTLTHTPVPAALSQDGTEEGPGKDRGPVRGSGHW